MFSIFILFLIITNIMIIHIHCYTCKTVNAYYKLYAHIRLKKREREREREREKKRTLAACALCK